MKDQLLIITRIKKTISFLEKIIDNFPTKEIVLRDNLKQSTYELLELAYSANIFNNEERVHYQKELLVKIRMIDFYIQMSCDKKLVSYAKYEKIGNHLLEITKLLYAWIKSNEASETAVS